MSPAMGDAHKLEIAQFPTSGVQADYPAQFMVRKNGAVGQLDAKVTLNEYNVQKIFDFHI
jgi:filamin